jgi:hypothetical protein
LQNEGKDAAVLRRKPNNLGKITTENGVFSRPQVTGSTLAVVKNISQTRPFYARLMSNDGYCPECHEYIGEDNWDECPECGAIIESDD